MGFEWLNSTHFRQIHILHQPVHSSTADIYAIITLETNRELSAAKTFVGFCVQFDDPGSDLSVFFFPIRFPATEKLVVGAPVYPKHPAQGADRVFTRQKLDRVQSLSE